MSDSLDASYFTDSDDLAKLLEDERASDTQTLSTVADASLPRALDPEHPPPNYLTVRVLPKTFADFESVFELAPSATAQIVHK